MGTEKVRRIIEIEAKSDKLTGQLRQINDATAKAAASLKKLEKSTKETSEASKKSAASLAKFESSLAKISRAVKGFGTIYLAQQLFWVGRSFVDAGFKAASLVDELELLQLRLERLSSGGGSANVAATVGLARELGLSFQDAADNVALLAPAFERLSIPFGRVTEFSGNLVKALRVYGTDARRAQIVTVQLAQALSSGQLSGDELRSLNENAGALGLSLEKAVQSALGTTQGIKELGSSGALTSEVVLAGFEEAFKKLEADMERLPDLLGYAVQRVQNEWKVLLVNMSNAVGLTDKYRGGLEFAEDILQRINITIATLSESNEPLTLYDVKSLEEQLERVRELREEFEKPVTLSVAAGALDTAVSVGANPFARFAEAAVTATKIAGDAFSAFFNKLTDYGAQEERLANALLVKQTDAFLGVIGPLAKYTLLLDQNRTAQAEWVLLTENKVLTGAEQLEEQLVSTFRNIGVELGKPIKLNVDPKDEIKLYQERLTKTQKLIEGINKLLKDSAGSGNLLGEGEADLKSLRTRLELEEKIAKKRLEMLGIGRDLAKVEGGETEEQQRKRLEAAKAEAEAWKKVTQEAQKRQQAFRGLDASLDPAVAAYAQLKKNIDVILASLDKQEVSSEKAAEVMRKALAQYRDLMREISTASRDARSDFDNFIIDATTGFAGFDVLVEQLESARRALLTTPAPESFAGAGEVIGNIDLDNIISARTEYENLKQSFDPILAAQEEYRKEIEIITTAMERLGIDGTEAQGLINAAQKKLLGTIRDVRIEVRGLRGDWANLVIDTVTGLPGFEILLEQMERARRALLTTPAPESFAGATTVINETDERIQEKLNRDMQEYYQLLDDIAKLEKTLNATRESGDRSPETLRLIAAAEVKLKELYSLKKEAEAAIKEFESKGYNVDQDITRERELGQIQRKLADSARDAERASAKAAREREQQVRELNAQLKQQLKIEEQIKEQISNTNPQAASLVDLKTSLAEIQQSIAETQTKLNNLGAVSTIPDDPFKRYKETIRDAKEETEELNRARGELEDGYARLIEQLFPAKAETERYAEAVKILNSEYAKSPDRVVESAEALEKLAIAHGRVSANIKAAQNDIEGFAFSTLLEVEQAFGSWIDSAIDGTFKLRDALQGLLKDLAKLAFRKGVNVIFDEIFATQAAKGYAFNSLTVPPGVYDEPTFFRTSDAGPLKRYASGGVLGEAGPEAVLPLARMPSGDLGVQGGAANVQVNIIEQPGNGTGEVKQRQGSDGKTIIDVVVDRVRSEIAGDISSGRGVAIPMERQYGLVRTPGGW